MWSRVHEIIGKTWKHYGKVNGLCLWPQFHHWQNEENHRTCLIRLLWGIHEILSVKYLEQCRHSQEYRCVRKYLYYSLQSGLHRF